MDPTTLGCVLGGAASLASLGCGSGASPATPVAPTPPPVRPNFVLVVADDLDVPTTDRMPRLQEFARGGLSFTGAYVAQPLCGPSRASILTGQYAHNHGVLYNDLPDGGFPAFRRSEGSTLATWLKAAGYRTSLVGKYLNAYPRGASDGYIPPGWDDWHGHLTAMEDGRYFNYWVNENGNVVRYGSRPEDYRRSHLSAARPGGRSRSSCIWRRRRRTSQPGTRSATAGSFATSWLHAFHPSTRATSGRSRPGCGSSPS